MKNENRCLRVAAHFLDIILTEERGGREERERELRKGERRGGLSLPPHLPLPNCDLNAEGE